MDMVTILTMLIALLIGAGAMYLYNKYRNDSVDKVFAMLNDAFDTYGERLLKDNPALYEELDEMLDIIEEAMSDDKISIMEAFDIAKSAIPLVKRLTKYIDNTYK